MSEYETSLYDCFLCWDGEMLEEGGCRECGQGMDIEEFCRHSSWNSELGEAETIEVPSRGSV